MGSPLCVCLCLFTQFDTCEPVYDVPHKLASIFYIDHVPCEDYDSSQSGFQPLMYTTFHLLLYMIQLLMSYLGTWLMSSLIVFGSFFFLFNFKQ